MRLKCKICSFIAPEKKIRTREKREIERNVRKHIAEEHGDILPRSNYKKGEFYAENIIYLKDVDAANTTPKKSKKRTASVPITRYFPPSPGVPVKKRTRSTRVVPEKPQRGEEKTHAQADLPKIKSEPEPADISLVDNPFEESDEEPQNTVKVSRKNCAKKTEENTRVPEVNKTELMSPDAQDLHDIVESLDDHMEHEIEQEIDEETEEDRRLRNLQEQYERSKHELEREIHGFVLQLPSQINRGFFDATSEYIPIEQRQCVWEECPKEHLMPGFPAESRDWRPVVLDDEQIGSIKGFRLKSTQSGKYSAPYIARLVFLHYTPFTGRWRNDKKCDFNEQFYYLFCHTHDLKRTTREHEKQRKQFESNRSIKTKEQFAKILRHAQSDEKPQLEELRNEPKRSDISMEALGLALSDDEDEEKKNVLANGTQIESNFEAEIDVLQLSSTQNRSGIELSDEEDEDDDNVDGKQARKEWNRRQKEILLERLAKSMINNKHLKKRRDQAKDEVDLLTQNNRHSEIDQRIEDPEYKCGTCHRPLDSVEGVPKEAHEAICAETRRYLDRRN